MKDIGIDKISFYTPKYYLDLKDLAKVRKVDPNKYLIGLGQEKMSVLPPNEDIITMAANAANNIIDDFNRDKIDTLLFATETGIDYSKSAGMHIHRLLNIKNNCRVVELKQACYSTAMGLQLAIAWVNMNPDSKVLLIASDVSRYGLGTPGEPTQGCASVAMIISAEPRIIKIDENSCGVYAQDVMDFWRPNNCQEAIVDGPLSTQTYLELLEKTWYKYSELTGRTISDFANICYHTPFTKMVKKAHFKLTGDENNELLRTMDVRLNTALNYNRIIGNSYTASLFINFCSLVDCLNEDLSNHRIGFYSYGSGSVAEFFSGVITSGYKKHLNTVKHKYYLNNRKNLTYHEYERIFKLAILQYTDYYVPETYEVGDFCLSNIVDNKRYYKKL
jgi:hydroxymethylglutaryl-CoA synthase